MAIKVIYTKAVVMTNTQAAVLNDTQATFIGVQIFDTINDADEINTTVSVILAQNETVQVNIAKVTNETLVENSTVKAEKT